MTIYEDMNPDWASGVYEQPEWEPWVEDEVDDSFITEDPMGCDFCGASDVREYPEPYSSKPCCDRCFLRLIGDDELSDSDPIQPWKCGTVLNADRYDHFKH